MFSRSSGSHHEAKQGTGHVLERQSDCPWLGRSQSLADSWLSEGVMSEAERDFSA